MALYEQIVATRLYRLRLLSERFGGPGLLAQAVGKVDVSIYRLRLATSSGRNLGEKLARDIEKNLKLALYWLDGVGEDTDPFGKKRPKGLIRLVKKRLPARPPRKRGQ